MNIKNARYLILFFVTAAILFSINVPVHAQYLGGSSGGDCPEDTDTIIRLCNPLTANTFQELLQRILDVLLIVATPVFVIFIMISGLLYIVGGANPQRRQTAFNIIKYGIIGFVIILTARLLLGIVQGIVGIK
jgi:hypothetical protein